MEQLFTQTNENIRHFTQYRCHFRRDISDVVGHSSARSRGGCCAALGQVAGVDVSMLPSFPVAGMTGGPSVKLVGGRRQERAAFFYFNRLRQRRAPLVAAARCRPPTKRQFQEKPPPPHEANRRETHEGLAMLESLVESSFSADSRLGSFLRSVASKETASWDAVSGKLGVFPCAPPVFSLPGSIEKRARRLHKRARLRVVEQQFTSLIISFLTFQVLGRPKTAPKSCRMGGTRSFSFVALPLHEVSSIVPTSELETDHIDEF